MHELDTRIEHHNADRQHDNIINQVNRFFARTREFGDKQFDTQMLVDHIKALKDNVPIEHPVYSFVDHDRTSESVSVKPSKVIIVDGILIFENKELRDLMDIKVYVDTDADIRLARRILRDVCERGRTMQSVITQYTSTVKPMHEEFVEPSKKYADVIIPEGGFNSVAVAMLIQNIRSLIQSSK